MPSADDDPRPAAPAGPPPLLRVVRGDPRPEELAALVAVLAARAGATGGTGGAPASSPQGAWGDHRRGLRGAVAHGPDGWRRSALPG